MIEALINWLSRFRKQYRVVEVKNAKTHIRWDNEVKETVQTLSGHPGFIALTDRLSLQRDLLQSKLNHEFHKDMREIDFTQAGIFWTGWLQDQVAKATTKGSVTKYRDAFEEEAAAFGAIDAHIERIK